MKFKFEPRDFWVGFYVGKAENIIQIGCTRQWERTVYFCPLPMLCFYWKWRWNEH